MANGHGGKRPGSGRPPKHVVYETPIRAAERKITDRLPWLVDKLLELADGVYEERQVGDDTVVVYKTRPDRQSAEYLLDRILGKPVDRQEHGDPGTFKQGYTIRLVRTDEGADDTNAAAS